LTTVKTYGGRVLGQSSVLVGAAKICEIGELVKI